ncbi:hypothetical protein Bbelb_108970 [Branchiostoma belcheri]|nr:hypothetical protein Bbelb_108970 [Branchiostoma belcheri]
MLGHQRTPIASPDREYSPIRCANPPTAFFDPHQKKVRSNLDTKWVTWEGEPWTETQQVPPIKAEEAVLFRQQADPTSLPFRDPKNFIAGSLHNNVEVWRELAEYSDKGPEVLDWIVNKVRVSDFFTPFEGEFKGQAYKSATPPPITLPNARSCYGHEEFVTSEIMNRLEDGSIGLWGKVGQCEPPHLVLPLTVEPSKPRLCWDGRFLNQWTKDCPFQLDSITEAPRVLTEGGYMTHTDEKSGYSHIELSEESRKYFGFQFKGYFFVHNTLAFGWKGSAYVYHTTGTLVSSYARHLGVPTMLYIDDRLNGELAVIRKLPFQPTHFQKAQVASYVMCDLLTRAGYFLSLLKCIIAPTQILVHLGCGLNSAKAAFFFPEEKQEKFAVVREAILTSPTVSILDLQKFVGKCVSFALMVPGARIYTRQCNSMIGTMSRQGKSRAKLTDGARSEIEHWRFVDAGVEPVPWRDERHTAISMATDASGYKWGRPEEELELGDYWQEHETSADINCKEARAVAFTLKSTGEWIKNSRVTVRVDNKAAVDAWQGSGARSVSLNEEIKHIFETVVALNISLTMKHVKTSENEADRPSRQLTKTDCKLAPHLWNRLQAEFGGTAGHTVDLMALDSNAQSDRLGRPLRHYTPYPTPNSAGVDMFRYDPRISPQGHVENAYVFPPINMTSAVVSFLIQKKANVTIVVPKLSPRPLWWPTLLGASTRAIKISEAGSTSALHFPSKKGLRPGKVFKYELWAPLPLVPRQWKPAAACPECHHLNDHDFRQCQMCAYQRRPFPPPRRSIDIDEEKIKRRLDEVNNMAKNTDYGKKKAALENELVDFLGNIYPPKDLVTASPKDVCAFLVWKDKGGKTTVHNKNCKNYGNKKATGCGCPRRLAAGTVDSLIGQLRSIFANSGRGGDWNDAIGTGNPAAAPKVREYLRVTKAEQADALVQPTQAQPVFFEKLSTICGHIKKKMENPGIKGVTLFNLARDQAFFKTMFFAADRASDLGRCKSEELAWLPKGEGILFNHTFGKTLRDGTSNTFPVLAGKDRSMCPVQAVRAYIRIAQALNVSLNRGYLFRTVSKSGEVVNEPFTYDAAQSRFKAYLTEMGSYEGETLHGLRTASAITMALGGADQTALMSHVGWRSEATARRYMRLDRICHEASPAAILQAQVERRDETEKPAEAATRGQCGVGTFYQQRNYNDYKPLF